MESEIKPGATIPTKLPRRKPGPTPTYPFVTMDVGQVAVVKVPEGTDRAGLTRILQRIRNRIVHIRQDHDKDFKVWYEDGEGVMVGRVK